MLGKLVIAYISDILIYSPKKADYITHVRKVLAQLLENQLFVKWEKCDIYLTKISFLGCVLNKEGVKNKVAAMTNLVIPTTVR